MRRTKIVCTLGPSSNEPDLVRELVRSGMDVARLNFSHGTHDDHRSAYGLVRGAAEELGRNVAIMMDLQGPKIRTGRIENGAPVTLEEGAALRITTDDVVGNAALLSTTYEALPHDVHVDDRILMADGALELVVEEVSPPEVLCRVVRGGTLGEHKGINLPGVAVSAPSLTEKDLDDLAFGLELGVDYVALSFVRGPDDLAAIKQRMAELGRTVPVVAKIERPEAVARFDEILPLCEGIMVARGDLGVEMDLDDVPQIQKAIIHKCNRHGVPVITATQMLESMMSNARPTRAEVTDVANAIYDGTDAVMLSGETAAGRFPVLAVRVMARVAAKADLAIAAARTLPDFHGLPAGPSAHAGAANAIGHAVSHITDSLDVTRIVCFTMSGYTAAMIARYRPRTPITAVTLDPEAGRRCALFWGVDALVSKEVTNTDEMLLTVDAIVQERHLARAGDTIVIVAGMPLAVGGRTNLLKVHTVGEQDER
ncbi:MAG: pyruvate kinase [Candidatus Hydrogenedentes bacterium]|nr:pyruvate kinase [Candidatus Hydrogenedentota bacterium]